uniref:Uncharacterized protein n=1 Tax=Rhizophora mucronata TaxID=61149 RepID=A0A2P2MY43_RHIMU
MHRLYALKIYSEICVELSNGTPFVILLHVDTCFCD